MEIRPSHIAGAIGFDAVRDRVVGLTASSAGGALARAMMPMDFSRAVEELAIVTALQGLRDGGGHLPEPLFDPVDELVAEVRPKGAYLDPDGLLEIRRLCASSEIIRRFLEGAPEATGLPALGSEIAPLPGISESIGDLLEDDGEIKDSASSELRAIRRRLRGAQGQVRKALMDSLRRATGQGWATEEQPTLRGGRLVLPIRAEAKRKVGGIVHDVSATGQTAFVEPAECVELNNDVRELEAEERREIVRLLIRVSDGVRTYAEQLLQNQALLANYDVRRAKAILASELGGTAPVRGDDGIIVLRRARNPELLLVKGKNAREVVPLSMELGADHSMLVISGPNAGGKSVAMKTVGLFASLLAVGIPVPCDPDSRFDRFDALFGDIGDEQSIEDDLSTFSSRLARTRDMVTRADARTLVLIDEAGTGTDPAEGAALAQAALEALHEAGARVVVTTHHSALKMFAHERKGVLNAMMRFDQESLRPTYALEQGVPGSSYAFEIAHRMGLPDSVVDRGRELLGADHVSMERLLSDLQSRNRQLEEEIEARAGEAQKAAEQRKILENRLAGLTGARDEIRHRALDEADRILGGANAEIERAIREIRESQAEKGAVKAVRKRLEDTKSTVGKEKKKTARRSRAKAPRTEAVSGPLAVGDQVRLGTDGPAGEVMELGQKEAVVAVGPAHTRVPLHRLIKVGGRRQQRVSVSARVEPTAARIRIDLRGKRVLEAVAEVERFVDEALAAGLSRAEILHGKGTGALRGTIHEYLTGRDDVATFEEAPIEQGGAGITIVYL